MSDTPGARIGGDGQAFVPGPLRIALWFALVAGLVEGLVLTLVRLILDRYTHVDASVAWLAPVSLACWFLLLAAPLAVLARRRADPLAGIAAGLFAALGALDILMLATRVHPVARVALAAGIGVQVGQFVAARVGLAARVIRATLGVLAAIVALVFVGMHGARMMDGRTKLAALPPAASGMPNVLLVVLDAVRAQDLSVYGYERPTTPGLERLAARGTVFDRAMAPAPWTLPSHASMFTGRAAHELTADWRVPLQRDVPTLAEALAALGYTTGGFVANLEYTTRESGLARGFVHYDDYRHTAAAVLAGASLPRALANARLVRRTLQWHEVVGRKSTATITAAARDWIAQADRPWFAFLNLYDAHNPYLPPAPYDTMFTGARAPWSRRHPDLIHRDSLSPAQAQPERDAYDQAIRWQDDVLAAFLDSLAVSGRLQHTLIIVTADHGEEFAEHGLLSHGGSLYMPSLHVPLVMVLPDVVPAGRRVGATVSLRDLAATILEVVRAPTRPLPGTSLLPLLDSAGQWGPAIASVRFASGQPAWFPISKGDMVTAVTNTLQLIRDGAGAERAFDLAADPGGRQAATADTAAIQILRTLLPEPR